MLELDLKVNFSGWPEWWVHAYSYSAETEWPEGQPGLHNPFIKDKGWECATLSVCQACAMFCHKKMSCSVGSLLICISCFLSSVWNILGKWMFSFCTSLQYNVKNTHQIDNYTWSIVLVLGQLRLHKSCLEALTPNESHCGNIPQSQYMQMPVCNTSLQV